MAALDKMSAPVQELVAKSSDAPAPIQAPSRLAFAILNPIPVNECHSSNFLRYNHDNLGKIYPF
jgi:hypothetical protein